MRSPTSTAAPALMATRARTVSGVRRGSHGWAHSSGLSAAGTGVGEPLWKVGAWPPHPPLWFSTQPSTPAPPTPVPTGAPATRFPRASSATARRAGAGPPVRWVRARSGASGGPSLHPGAQGGRGEAAHPRGRGRPGRAHSFLSAGCPLLPLDSLQTSTSVPRTGVRRGARAWTRWTALSACVRSSGWVTPASWVRGPSGWARVHGCALRLWRLLRVLPGLRAHRPPCLVHRRQ